VTGLLTPQLVQWRLVIARPHLLGDVLDLGCGGADVVRLLGPNQTYVGVDWRADIVQQLQARFPMHLFRQLDLDTQALDFQRRFDSIVLLAVIEHLRQPQHLFAQLANLVEPTGQIVMTSPSPFGHRLHAFGARLGLFSREAAAEHHTVFNRETLATLIRPYGLTLAVYRPFLFGCNQLFVCRNTPTGSQ
jgi:2-polyprenyl-3-methyl-5-hydroxy-6-metoxy-1,4-benzoquinol methylase